MSKFKEMLERDIKNVFLNPNEFGEEHVIEGKTVVCVLDDYMTTPLKLNGSRQNMQIYEGVYTGGLVVYVKLSDLEFEPVPSQHLDVDDVIYLVVNCRNDYGMLTITLEASTL